jgi:serine/threonine-protein kinase
VKDAPTRFTGKKLGNIRLLEQLSEGGMGAVYLGHDETLDRQVAVKVIHSSKRLGTEAKVRFLREARILSSLNHPAICTVHDFIEEEEHDYLVLELIDGVSLGEAIKAGLSDTQKHSIAAQLIEVLAVVHEQGIVHRDLKPDNVMISDGTRVKVLDFGIARTTDGGGLPPIHGDDEEVETEYPGTQSGAVLGTVGYMSPEQARGEAATPASDIYSAGLVLQQLFTGTTPFVPGTSPRELLLDAAEGRTAAVRGLSPELTSLINRLKSMAPACRPSAIDAAALLRQIRELPQQRRRRRAVAAVWLALLVLSSGLAVQWSRALSEAERASREASTAEEVTAFLVDLFRSSDPEEQTGDVPSARTLLDRGRQRVELLTEQPEVQGRLLSTMGTVYLGLGLYDDAEQLLERAVELQQEVLGADHLKTATSLDRLATVYEQTGRVAEAGGLFERVLETRRRHLGEAHPDVAVSLSNLGLWHRSQGHLEQAETLFLHALEIKLATLGREHLDTAVTMANLAGVHQQKGELEQAQRLLRQSVEIRSQLLGSEHPRMANALTSLATVYQLRGMATEAEQCYRRALAINRKTRGPNHPRTADSMLGLASIIDAEGESREALELYRQGIAVYEQTHGSEHMLTAWAQAALADLHVTLGDLEESERLFQRALTVYQKLLGPDNLYTLACRRDMARLRHAQGRLDEAEQIYRAVLDKLDRISVPESVRRKTLARYHELLVELERTEEATRIQARLDELTASRLPSASP